MMWLLRTRGLLILCLPVVIAVAPALASAQESLEKAAFRVKYIAEGVVYLNGGSAAGIKEGQKLTVVRAATSSGAGAASANASAPPATAPAIATLKVISVAASSAVCEIETSSEPPQVGDFARFAPEVVAAERAEEQQQRLQAGREYPQLITFTTAADPIVEEARAAVPRPPSPEINRMRGRIGFEYSTVLTRDNPSSTSSEVGVVARFDMSRIAGSYWNFDGYWRGRFTTLSGPAAPATINDLINRTYTLNLEYNNPESKFVAGGGRLYLPWATSLDIMDGGYFGRKASDRTTVGVFGGSTPDPTSYDYNPKGKLGGAFVNVSGGSFDSWRYSVTLGVAISAIGWQANRDFGFLESSISLGHNLFLYDSMEIDTPHTAMVTPSGTPVVPGGPAPPMVATSTGGLNRSYLTIRFVPNSHLEFQVNDTYFRDFPSFNPLLIGTGLLDKYLFQGVSGGVRVNLPAKISLYTDVGKSSASGDANGSWNQMYGITLGEVAHTGLHADLRYSKFSSAFGSGNYKAVSVSRSIGDRLEWQLLGGFQNLNSTLTTTTQTHFVTTNLDWSFGKLFFLEGGYTYQRGGTMNYDQMLFMVGKRF